MMALRKGLVESLRREPRHCQGLLAVAFERWRLLHIQQLLDLGPVAAQLPLAAPADGAPFTAVVSSGTSGITRRWAPPQPLEERHMRLKQASLQQWASASPVRALVPVGMRVYGTGAGGQGPSNADRANGDAVAHASSTEAPRTNGNAGYGAGSRHHAGAMRAADSTDAAAGRHGGPPSCNKEPTRTSSDAGSGVHAAVDQHQHAGSAAPSGGGCAAASDADMRQAGARAQSPAGPASAQSATSGPQPASAPAIGPLSSPAAKAASGSSGSRIGIAQPPSGVAAANAAAADAAALAAKAREGAAAAFKLGMNKTQAGLNLLVADLSIKLNHLTGYNVIERLRAQVSEAERGLDSSRTELLSSKAAYEEKVEQHSELQREITSLLQRKTSWNTPDVGRFAELCKSEHEVGEAVARAKSAYGDAAEALESAHDVLLRAIRERYSAEQMWSEKIRRASTWWTAGLVALNLVSFLTVYIVLEPIKAARLRRQMEEVLRQESSDVRKLLAALQTGSKLPPQAGAAAATAAAAAAEAAAVRRDANDAVLQQLGEMRQQLQSVAGAVGRQAVTLTAVATALSAARGGSAAQAAAAGAGSDVHHPSHGAAELPSAATDDNLDDAVLGGDGAGLVEGLAPRRKARAAVSRAYGWLVQPSSQLALATSAAAFAGAAVGGLLVVLAGRDR